MTFLHLAGLAGPAVGSDVLRFLSVGLGNSTLSGDPLYISMARTEPPPREDAESGQKLAFGRLSTIDGH